MIDFTSETYREILERMLARIPNTYDKRDTAPIPTALSPAAYALEGFYLTLNQVQQAAFIGTASGDNLDSLAIFAGLSRREASPAVRLGVFNVSVPIGSRFSVPTIDALDFIVTGTTGNPVQYELTAETAGTIGNDYTGAILPITAIENLNSAMLTDILIPGENSETDDELRVRIIERLNEKPFAGNIAAYRENILAIDGVGAVQIYPTWDGGGTVKCAIIGADYLPASSTLVENVQNAIDPPPNQGLGVGLAPIGATVTIVSGQSLTVDIAADITPQAGYTIGQLREPIETALQGYMESLRQNWGAAYGAGVYAITVFLSRVIASIISVEGVANATNVQLNGTEADIVLQEDATKQEVPELGEVTLNVA